eukprot:1143253-Pelagomonas_calceolata.AAC.4
MLGSTQGCDHVTRGRSGCKAMSLPASTCTPISIGHPSTLPLGEVAAPAKSDTKAWLDDPRVA